MIHFSSLHLPQSGSACIATQSSFRRFASTNEGSPTAHLWNEARKPMLIMIPVTRFPALRIRWVFAHYVPDASSFPALGTGSLFSRPWHRSLVFPRYVPVQSFPALRIRWVFARYAPVAYFPALGTGCSFPRA